MFISATTMTPNKRPSPATEFLGVVILAAGYGTRLAATLAHVAQFSNLSSTPKPLLPVGGRTILSHWIHSLSALPAISSIVVVTNGAHLHIYDAWADRLRNSWSHDQTLPLTIVSDGTQANHHRLGAVKDIEIGLSHVASQGAQKAIIIAGDCLFPYENVLSHVEAFCRSEHHAAAFAYRLEDMSEVPKRGVFSVQHRPDATIIAKKLVEKPETPSQAPSNLASAPVYMLKKELFGSVSDFLQEHENSPLRERDAPGFWLSWLIPRASVRIFTAQQRLDVGDLSEYKNALHTYTIPQESTAKMLKRLPDEPAVGRAYPRVGILGNPSDGYNGKVISASIASEGYAEVVATPSEKLVISPNPKHEFFVDFDNISHLVQRQNQLGIHFSARQLVASACVIFAKAYSEFKSDGKDKSELTTLPNCELTYSSTIPTSIGLSGSSAFILATLRALARFHNLSLEEICEDKQVWANLIYKAEVEILNISGGRQDSVLALMQGCVAMDFSKEKLGTYRRLNESLLPELWLCYVKGAVGESSGKVHGDLLARYARGDQTVIEGIKELIELTDRSMETFESGDMKDLAKHIGRNFELRTKLFGDEAIGDLNRKLVAVAKKAGFAAKMTGSGGCALCIPNPVRKLTSKEIQNAAQICEAEGMVLRRVTILRRRLWLKGE